MKNINIKNINICLFIVSIIDYGFFSQLRKQGKILFFIKKRIKQKE